MQATVRFPEGLPVGFHSLLLTRDIGTQEIYALNVNWH